MRRSRKQKGDPLGYIGYVLVGKHGKRNSMKSMTSIIKGINSPVETCFRSGNSDSCLSILSQAGDTGFMAKS